MANREKIYKTRYKELGYVHQDRNLWRFVDLTDDGAHYVGYHYRTRAELLADLDRYAWEFGCEDAKGKAQPCPTCKGRGVITS